MNSSKDHPRIATFHRHRAITKMKFINTSLLIFGLILTFVSCLKIPTPSPTVLIVNHLNYLRYDYHANPTSLRPNGYPFYETTAHLNRSFSENLYSLNRTTNALNGLINLNELDNQLNGRLDQQLSNELNDRLANHLASQPNDRQVHIENDQLNEPLNDQLSDQPNVQIDQQASSQIGRGDHQVSAVPLNSQSIEHSQSNDLNNNLNSDSYGNDLNNNLMHGYPEIDQQLNHLTISDHPDDLILTNHTDHQARLLELELLQQNEPSLSLVLDADSPFLNSAQVSFFLDCFVFGTLDLFPS